MTRLLAVVVGLQLLAPAPGAAQTVLETGVIIVRRGDSVVAREDFELRDGRSGGAPGFTLRTTARYGYDLAAGLRTGVIEFEPDSQPAVAQFSTGGPAARRTLATIGARRITIRTVSPSTEASGQYRRDRPVMVLSDSLFALYLWRPGAKGAGVHGVTATGEMMDEVAVQDRGLVTGVLQGRRAQLHHVSVSGSGMEILLWYEDDTLVRAEVPRSGIVAERVRPPGS